MDDPPHTREPFTQPATQRLLLIGGALALLAGVLIAWALLGGQKGQPVTLPPASQAGLVIDSSAVEDGRLDPARPLRCFVEGQSVGELTLAECARRNGVATDALDVGVDGSGTLAAAEQAGTVLTPLPPVAATPVAAPAEPAPVEAPAALPVGSSGACWRYAGGQWRKQPADLTLSACLQTLFAGHCERPGGATYGRWSQQTLRLVPGKVEISGDNRSFRTLVPQPGDCSLPNIG